MSSQIEMTLREELEAARAKIGTLRDERDALRRDNDRLEQRACDLAADLEERRAETRNADALEAMPPDDGYQSPLLPGTPAGCSCEVVRYPDSRECRVTFRYPGAGGSREQVTVELSRLPLLYLKVLAEQAARVAGPRVDRRADR